MLSSLARSAGGGGRSSAARNMTPRRAGWASGSSGSGGSGGPADASGSRPNGTHTVQANSAISRRSDCSAARPSACGSQAAPSNDQGRCAFSIRTALCLSSGWREWGQAAGLVSSLTPARHPPSAFLPERNSPPQCIGIQACMRPTCSLAATGSTIEPRREVTRTISPATKPRRSKSIGLISTAGSGTWPNNLPSVPVRLMPCH